MGLSPTDFGQMRLSHFFLKLKGWVDYKQGRYRDHAELVRLQTISLININLSIEDQYKLPTDLWKFTWEEDEEEITNMPPSDPEQMKQLLKAFKQ